MNQNQPKVVKIVNQYETNQSNSDSDSDDASFDEEVEGQINKAFSDDTIAPIQPSQLSDVKLDVSNVIEASKK